MPTQAEKGSRFRALHEREGAFVIPNPWDIGSAMLLAQMGFEALATTSAGFAYSIGKPDGGAGRDAMLAHVAALASAVDLPVSGDLENCYADDPEAAAKTVEMAASVGLVGCSIEDATGRPDDPIYEMELARDRVRAAAEAAHALTFPFTLTARCENFLHGRRNLDDTIARLRAYQEAGADVLYAPGLTTLEEVGTVVRAVNRPVNAIATAHFDVASLERLGVKRISVGSALARAAYSTFLKAAREMRGHGTFTFAADAVKANEFDAIFRRKSEI
jgi:2-methylisocitrate lyase-like PEP mutase family enzyme